jgi:HEAT repeat protein
MRRKQPIAMDGALHSFDSRRIALPVLLATVAVAYFAGCSTYIGTTSQSFLRHVRTDPDPNIRYIAYAKLGTPGLYEHPGLKAEAVDVLIAKLSEGKEPIATRAVIIRSLGDLGDRRAREVIVRCVDDHDGVIRAEACRALGKVGRPEDATILARIMTVDMLEDCRIAAIEGIGKLRSTDTRIFQILLDGLDHDDPAIRLACYRSLKELTGKDPGNTSPAWRKELEARLAAESTKAVNSSKPAPGAKRAPVEQNSGPGRQTAGTP